MTPLVALLLVLAAPAPDALPPAVTQRLRAVVEAPELSQGFVGAVVQALGRRAAGPLFDLLPFDSLARPELFAHNADRCFCPASTFKLLTSAAGLDALGPDYRFTTRLLARAPLDGRVSTLYLVGGGDPSLGYAQLRQLVAQLRAAGVRRVGQVAGDGTRYRDRYPEGWTVDDTTWYYGAEVSALALERNEVDVTLAAGEVGEPVKVTLEPANTYLKIRPNVTVVARGPTPELTWERQTATPTFVVRGKLPAGTRRSEGVAVQKCERYAAHVLTSLLRAAGVVVEDLPLTLAAPSYAVELAKVESPPLSALLERLLKHSDNLYAEMLLRELGVATTGIGDLESGHEGLQRFMVVNGIDYEGLRATDGAGLSRYDVLSPRTLAGVLRVMAAHPDHDLWYRCLPIGGVDGTLARRFKGTAGAGNVHAKTGYITARTSLAGYVTNTRGETLAAVTMFNHYSASTSTARGLHDRFFVTLAEW